MASCCDYGGLWLIGVCDGWKEPNLLSVVCVNLGGCGGKSETKVHSVTPFAILDDGVSEWTFVSDLTNGVTEWTFGMDFRFRFILRQPERATRRKRRSIPKLHSVFY